MPSVVNVSFDGRVGGEHVESLSGRQRRAGRIQPAAYVPRESGATVGAVFRKSLINCSHGAQGWRVAVARLKALAFRMPESKLEASATRAQVSLAANESCIGGETRTAEPRLQSDQLDGAKVEDGSVTAWRRMPIEVAPRDIQVIGGRRAIGTALTGAGREKRQKCKDHRQGRGETQAFLHRGQHGVSSLRKPDTNFLLAIIGAAKR